MLELTAASGKPTYINVATIAWFEESAGGGTIIYFAAPRGDRIALAVEVLQEPTAIYHAITQVRQEPKSRTRTSSKD